MNMLSECEKYILTFLTGREIVEKGRLAYVYEEEIKDTKADVIIVKSNFFNDNIFASSHSMPLSPVPYYKNIPVLFGKPLIEQYEQQIICHIDVIAGSFFLLSRYEETINMYRDKFGRFSAKASYLYKNNLLHRPIVDEYSKLLCQLLGIPLPQDDIGISVTHDIDIPYTVFTILSALKRIGGNLLRHEKNACYPLLNLCGNPSKDPLYIFDYFIQNEQQLPHSCEMVYFVMSGGKRKPYDLPIYIDDKNFLYLFEKLANSGAEFGLHSSFESADNFEKLADEHHKLERKLGMRITKHRNHYLRSKEPKDFLHLIGLGIEEDYTMGYADIAGFRLGTSRKVRFINPYNKTLTSLILHPLLAMDNTLMGPGYMNLSQQEALSYVLDLLKQSVGGSSLLFHNHILFANNELKQLYQAVIEYLIKRYNHI